MAVVFPSIYSLASRDSAQLSLRCVSIRSNSFENRCKRNQIIFLSNILPKRSISFRFITSVYHFVANWHCQCIYLYCSLVKNGAPVPVTNFELNNIKKKRIIFFIFLYQTKSDWDFSHVHDNEFNGSKRIFEIERHTKYVELARARAHKAHAHKSAHSSCACVSIYWVYWPPVRTASCALIEHMCLLVCLKI